VQSDLAAAAHGTGELAAAGGPKLLIAGRANQSGGRGHIGMGGTFGGGAMEFVGW